MRKFAAVVKHEYRKIVLKWSFLIGTLLLPFLAGCLAVVPALIFSLKGEPTKIVIVDLSGKIAPRIKQNLSAEKIERRAQKAMQDSLQDPAPTHDEKMKRNADAFAKGFVFIDFDASKIAPSEMRNTLNSKIMNGEADAYLLVPSDVNDQTTAFEFRSRKAGDFVVNDTLKRAVNDAVRSQRLADASINEDQLEQLGREVKFDSKGIDERGEEVSGEGTLVASFVVGLMIYITLAI
ncbi:MAG TPA: hypothetical protein VJV05_03245, partial [Pyrinomonadaceae bacterium]|nr:hypothetical protein [Pyrinomonadaceae bacterium]